MINIITGKPGTGKSYTLTIWTKKFLERGDDVFANFKIDERLLKLKPKRLWVNTIKNRIMQDNLPEFKKLGRLYYWSDLSQFRDIQSAIIVMDEAQTYFSARRWKDMTAEDEIKFQQHRKQGIDIYAGVQNLNRCDKVIRELASYVYVVRKIGNLFLRKRYTPEDYDLARRESSDSSFYWFDKDLALAYNTNELVNVEFDDFGYNNFKKMSDFFVS